MNYSAKFYRLNSLPNFATNGKHVGLFVYINADYTPANGWIMGYSDSLGGTQLEAPQTVQRGLWFGGALSWELLTNVGSGITWPEIYDWFDSDVAGEAEIFQSEVLTGDEHGYEITILDPILDRVDGLHESSDSSDAHTFTVGDGALKIAGYEHDVNTSTTPHTFTNVAAFDVHSANDTVDNTLRFDESMFITVASDDSDAPIGATIGVRTNKDVTPDNPIATMADLTGLVGAMHLIGTLDNRNDLNEATAEHLWPDETNSQWVTTWPQGTGTGEYETEEEFEEANPGKKVVHEGDTFIITTKHQGPGNILYEVGDTVVYYNNNGTLTYKVVNTNITTGAKDGQHAKNIGDLEDGKLVVAVNPGGIGSPEGIKTIDVDYTDLIVGIDTTQVIVNETTTSADEGQIHGATYTVTTTIDRVDDGSDSNISTDIHSFTLHSNNTSLIIKEHDDPSITDDEDKQFDFDLVWLDRMWDETSQQFIQ